MTDTGGKKPVTKKRAATKRAASVRKNVATKSPKKSVKKSTTATKKKAHSSKTPKKAAPASNAKTSQANKAPAATPKRTKAKGLVVQGDAPVMELPFKGNISASLGYQRVIGTVISSSHSVNGVMGAAARVSGLTFVIVGAFSMLFFSQLLFPIGSLSAALMNATTSTTTTTDSLPATSVTLDMDSPLSGVVHAKVVVGNAHKVVVKVVNSSGAVVWSQPANQHDADTWIAPIDTTTIINNDGYRVLADIWTQSTTNHFDLEVAGPTTYTILNVTPLVVSGGSTDTATTSDTQVTTATSTTTSSTTDTLQTTTADPSQQTSSTSDATTTTTTDIMGGSSTATSSNVMTTDGTTTVTTTDLSLPDATTTASEPSIDLAPLIISPLVGTVPVKIKATNAKSVAMYLRDDAGYSDRYLGNASPGTQPDTWYFNWYTKNTPDGSYKFFARSTTDYGTITSNELSVTVKNTAPLVAPKPTPDEQKAAELINSSDGTTGGDGRLSTDSSAAQPSSAVPEPSSKPAPRPVASSNFDLLFAVYENKFQQLLTHLGSAVRANDAAAETQVRQNLTRLSKQVIADTPTLQTNTDQQQAFIKWFNGRIDEYVTSVKQSDTLIKQHKLGDVLKDSDGDGLTDLDEVTLYHTDPHKADTDGDGIDDGTEIMEGFDPLNPNRQAKITYGTPADQGVVRADVLKVKSVTPLTPTMATGATTTQTSGPLVLTGTGLPDSFVTLYIYSTPVVVTVHTDSDGSWRYRFDQELENGTHHVYVGITDNAGHVVAKSNPFAFVKTANAITPVEAAAIANQAPSVPNDSPFSSYLLYVVLSLSVVSIGLILIAIGYRLRQENFVSTDLEEQPATSV